MKKYVFLTALLLVLMSGQVYAMSVDVVPKVQKTESLKAVYYTMTIENDQPYTDELAITINGSGLGWLKSYPDYLKLQPGDRRRFNITIYPEGNQRGVFEYNVTAVSTRYHDSVYKTFTLNVLYPLNIASFSVIKTGDQLEMDMALEAIGHQAATIVFQTVNADREVISETSYNADVNESKGVTIYTDAHGMLAGEYTVIATIPGTTLHKEAAFTVDAVRSVTETKTVSSNPFFEVVEITIENKGNIIEKNYEYSQEMPTDAMTGFITAPTSCDQEGDQRECRYVISELKPGMTANIVYRVDMWPMLGGYALGLIGLAGGAGFAYRRKTGLKLNKNYSKKGPNEYVVTLQLRNKFNKGVGNVVVRDWVSPLASVVNEFDSVKPVIRKSDAGTELIWKIDSLNKDEERVISYRISTMVNGGLRMPKAYARFSGGRDDKYKVYSNHLQMD